MKKKERRQWAQAPFAMAIIGSVGAVGLFGLRLVLMPFLRDADTGRFAANQPAMIFLALVVIVLGVAAYYTPHCRVDVLPSRALPTAMASIVAGAALGLLIAMEVFRWLARGILPPPGQIQIGTLTQLVMYAMFLFGILGAVALVLFGLQIAAEGGTRFGMRAFSVLAPVMWTWCRLAWYEMSYASTVGWSEKAYDFLMVIFEMMFLFKLARFVSGIGKAPLGELLFYTMATAMFSLSGPILRVTLYFTAGSEAFSASNLAGVADLGIGILALVFGWSLVHAYREDPPISHHEEEWLEEDDAPYDCELGRIFVLGDSEESDE